MIRTRALALAAAGAAMACGLAGPAQAAGAGGDPVGASFLQAVHQVDLAEIAMGSDARRSAVTGCVRQVAAKVLGDHTSLDATLTALASKLHVTLPAAPNAAQLSGLATVRAQAGTRAYDTGWLAAQAAGHQQLLALIDRVVSSGAGAQIVAAAQAIRPHVAEHLVMLRSCIASAGVAPRPSGAPVPGPVRAGLGGAAPKNDPATALVAAGTVVAAAGAGCALRRRRVTVPR